MQHLPTNARTTDVKRLACVAEHGRVILRICVKCGRSNNVTRKYCVRCGASLIQPIKKEEPKEVARIPEATQATTRVTTPRAETHKEPPTPKPEGIITSGGLTKPSSIQQDRVRTTEHHVGSTELKKAKDAFHRANQVGVVEEDGEIVETRMLRASEVRELMASMANLQDDTITQEPELTIQPESSPQRTSETGTAPIVTPRAVEEDSTSAKPILAPKAEPEVKPQEEEVEISPKPLPRAMPVMQAKEPIVEVAPSPVAPKPVIKTAAIVQTQEVESKTESPMTRMDDPEYRNDSTLGPMLLNHKIIHNELKQIESELDSVRLKQDAEVQKYHNAAEAKKIHYESLKEQLAQAKQELIDAGKQYYESEDRRKKELTGREKQLKKLQSSISKSEAAIDKRIRELDSKKKKRA